MESCALRATFYFHVLTLYSKERRKAGKMHLCVSSLLGVLALNVASAQKPLTSICLAVY